jgi:hypothetical protein
VGLVWSHDPEIYAGGSLATGRASSARQVKCDEPDKKGYPGPPGWAFGMGLTTPHSKKLIVMKVEQGNKLERFNDDVWKRTGYTEVTLATLWREEVERYLQVLGVRRWTELLTGQNGGTMFDRPKPTMGCSANGRRITSR